MSTYMFIFIQSPCVCSFVIRSQRHTNSLLFQKAERVLTCAQDVLHAFAHGTSVYSLIRRLLGRVESALMLTPEEKSS